MITSVANERIKAVRKLRDRKERNATGLFYIEGLHIVGDALASDAKIEYLIVAPDLLISDFGRELWRNAMENEIPHIEVSAEVFQNFALKDGPQGIAAVAKQKWTDLDGVILSKDDLWIALDSIQDPGNVGTIMRTMDAAGGKGVILLDHSTDPYDPTAMRASMGTLFTQKLVRTSFDDFARWVYKNQYAVIGTSDAASQDYHDTNYPNPVILMMGSEQKGLQEHHLKLCREVVSIPMQGIADSLNVSVAAAVVLFEINHQKRMQN